MKALLEVPAPVNTITSLRKFYDTTETYIRGLDSLNQCESTYGSLLTPIILQKLPPEVRTNITRAHETLSWCLNELMKCLINEINIMNAGSALNTGQAFIPTATFLTKWDTRKTERRNIHRPTRPSVKSKSVNVPACVYCKGEHSSTNCVKIKDREQRLNIVKEKQLCFNCLRSHKVSECRSKFNCMICSRRHHTSLCEEESRKKSTDEPPKTHDAKETQSSVLHSAHNFALGPVLLKTAVSMVTSSCTSTTANILFDEGSQSSFITERLAQKLQLQATGSETLCLSGFGDTERRIRHLDTATVYLQTQELNIPIKVLIVPEISVSLKTYQKHVGHLPYLKGLKGITKTCIRKVLGKSLVSMEVLQTIIAEVECIVNDRPLTHTSADTLDEEPLTPSHLLYGRRVTSPVYPDDTESAADDLSHDSADKLYRFKSATLEHFWSRWKHEYLTSLRAFHRTSGNHGDAVTIGDVVQIHDTSLPRNRWSLGVIEDVIVGNDGLIRAAHVRSRRGVTSRTISKQYPLELK